MSGRPLRVVFFGTPDFAVPTLDALLASQHAVVAVVTQPDRPRGRGQKVVDAPVKRRAREANLPILQPPTLRDPAFVTQLQAYGADLGVVAAYGKILTEAVLATPRLGMINVHASLLPRYRGAAPVHRAIMAGERETGVTIMRVVKALDAGAMLAVVRRPIDPDETSTDVEQALATLGAPLLVATTDRLADGPIDEQPQNEADATYAHRLTKEDGRIDWMQSARSVHDRVRGTHPWPLAFSFWNGHRFIIRRTAIVGQSGDAAAPGTVISASGSDLLVAAADDLVRIVEIQPEGKRTLSAREFVAGHRLVPGDRFSPEP